MIQEPRNDPHHCRSKPRASGDDPEIRNDPHQRSRVNPARAGMIRGDLPHLLGEGGKPRASGDDPIGKVSEPSRPT